MSTPSISSTPSQQPKSKPWRYFINFIVTIICTETLAVVAYYSSRSSSVLPLLLLFSLIPALIIWWVVNMLQDYQEKVEELRNSTTKYVQEITSQVERNSVLHDEMKQQTAKLENLIQNAAVTLELYPPFIKLLDKVPRQKALTRHFIGRSLKTALCIWNIDDGEYFKMIDKGIENCSSWQAIHHGKISDLNYAPYLDRLQNNPNIKSQRIVILSKQDTEQLKDRGQIERFLSKTRKTPSYWVDEDKFFEIAGLAHWKNNLRLDCVLHDGHLLLLRQRDRKIAMLSFHGDGEPICDGIFNAFDKLDLQLKGYPTNVEFQEIALDMEIE